MISIYLFFHFISFEREVTQIYQIDCFKDLFCHIFFIQILKNSFLALLFLIKLSAHLEIKEKKTSLICRHQIQIKLSNDFICKIFIIQLVKFFLSVIGQRRGTGEGGILYRISHEEKQYKNVCNTIWELLRNKITRMCNHASLMRVRVRVFNDTFNNISIISWQSVLLVVETGIPRENHKPAASH